jgi:rfaE bifunctional protein kinase chain/domain
VTERAKPCFASNSFQFQSKLLFIFFEMGNVLIIGDVMIDHYLLGECHRISPEAPVPVVNIKKEDWRLGGAANVANNLVALETRNTLIGIYGNDSYSNIFDQLLQNSHLTNNKLFKSNDRSTIIKSRVIVGAHQMIRLDKESNSILSEVEENSILDLLFEEIQHSDVILLSDYNKGVLTNKILKTVFEISKNTGIPTIVDPKAADFSKYKGVTFIKPNKREAEQASGIKIHDFSSLEQASLKIQEITQAEAIITTLSEDGVGVYCNENLQIIPTKAQKVFDVTGAGDTYLAAFTYEYLQTGNVFKACDFANSAAGVVVAKIGSATATLEEIHQLNVEIA